MVEGLDRFGRHFESHSGQYVLIGGAACTLAMDAVGRSFRAYKGPRHRLVCGSS